jgi:hypothetical protein
MVKRGCDQCSTTILHASCVSFGQVGKPTFSRFVWLSCARGRLEYGEEHFPGLSADKLLIALPKIGLGLLYWVLELFM